MGLFLIRLKVVTYRRTAEILDALGLSDENERRLAAFYESEFSSSLGKLPENVRQNVDSILKKYGYHPLQPAE